MDRTVVVVLESNDQPSNRGQVALDWYATALGTEIDRGTDPVRAARAGRRAIWVEKDAPKAVKALQKAGFNVFAVLVYAESADQPPWQKKKPKSPFYIIRPPDKNPVPFYRSLQQVLQDAGGK